MMSEPRELKSTDAEYTNYENIYNEIGELFLTIDELKQAVDFLLGDWLCITGAYSDPKTATEAKTNSFNVEETPVPARRVSLAEVLGTSTERLVEAQARIEEQRLRLLNTLIKC
jgi:hypothetical protein